jgi:hypothetical protein
MESFFPNLIKCDWLDLLFTKNKGPPNALAALFCGIIAKSTAAF